MNKIMRTVLEKGILLLFFACFSACNENIAHNLNEIDANKIISKFQKFGVEANKEIQSDGLWSLAVEKNNAKKAISLLESERLIRKENKENSGLSLMASSDEREFQLERSYANAIEETLLTIPGVLDAKVHLYKKNEDIMLLKSSEQKDSASVLLIATKDLSLMKGDIAALVGGAVGISADRISVILTQG